MYLYDDMAFVIAHVQYPKNLLANIPLNPINRA